MPKKSPTSAQFEKALRDGGHKVFSAQQCPDYGKGGWPSYDYYIRCRWNAYQDEVCETHGRRFDEGPA